MFSYFRYTLGYMHYIYFIFFTAAYKKNTSIKRRDRGSIQICSELTSQITMMPFKSEARGALHKAGGQGFAVSCKQPVEGKIQSFQRKCVW